MTITPKQAIEGNPFVLGLSECIDENSTWFETIELEEGAYLYSRGDIADGFYGVLSGSIKSLVAGGDGKQVVVSYAMPGDWFGEIGVWRNKTRLVDTQVAAKASLIKITSVTIRRICQQQPELLVALTDWLDERIHLAASLLEIALFMDVETRLAYWLRYFSQRCGKADPSGIEIDLYLTQEELGRLVGATREAVGRHLSRWKKSGWLALRYGKIVLLKPDELFKPLLLNRI